MTVFPLGESNTWARGMKWVPCAVWGTSCGGPGQWFRVPGSFQYCFCISAANIFFFFFFCHVQRHCLVQASSIPSSCAHPHLQCHLCPSWKQCWSRRSWSRCPGLAKVWAGGILTSWSEQFSIYCLYVVPRNKHMHIQFLTAPWYVLNDFQTSSEDSFSQCQIPGMEYAKCGLNHSFPEALICPSSFMSSARGVGLDLLP